MKHLILPRVLLLLSALLGLSATATAQRDSEFMRNFRRAMSINDLSEMTKLVERNEAEAVLAVIETCQEIAEQPNDELETDIDGLGKAWKKAYQNRFVDLQYEYFSFLSGEYKRHRAELIESFNKRYEEFAKARDAKEKGRVRGMGLEFEGLSAAFEDVGDYYMASQAAWTFAECFDKGIQGDDADLRLACKGYGRASEMRLKTALEDKIQASLKARFDELEFEGFGDPEKGPEARAKERAAEDASYRPTSLGASFEPVPEVDAVQRLFYSADELYPTWAQIPLGAKDTKTKIPSLKELSPMVIRDGAAKAKIDVDGDGAGDVDIPVTGKATLVTFELGADKRPFSFIATVGQEKDTFQGIQPFNLAPSDFSMTIYVAPASSIVGMLGETRVQVFDDNMDGLYGSPPLGWNYMGVRKGSSQYDTDSLLIGEAKRAIPWSELIQVGEDWYKLEANETFSDVILTKASEVKTGRLALDMKGLSCDYLIMRGRGNNEALFFEIAGDKKGVEVPIGSYELYSGRVSKGKRNSMMKALILPGENNKSYAVTEGKTTDVELGSPFGFDFDFTQTDDTVTVDGKSVVITGRGGETYQRMWNCVPAPEASERRVGGKKGSKGEKMRPVGSQQEMEPVGWDFAWFPLPVELTKKKKGEPVEVQLVEKKNKLFGKITSDWKAE